MSDCLTSWSYLPLKLGRYVVGCNDLKFRLWYLSFRNLRRQNSAFKQQTADYQIVLRFFVSYPFNSGLKYSKGLCQYFWFYNSNALSFSRKSYIPIVVIPASLRRMIMSLPTTIIFLNESSTFLKDDSSCRILFSSSIWYAD